MKLAFSIPEVHGGLAKAEGVAGVTEAGLSLEFEVEDGFLGALRSEAKKAALLVADLRSVESMEKVHHVLQGILDPQLSSISRRLPDYSYSARARLAVNSYRPVLASRATSGLSARTSDRH